MGILDEIVARKRERLEKARRDAPLGELKAKITETEAPRDFGAAIRGAGTGRVRLIAEVKHASPSVGVIRQDFNPREIALIYKDKADAISVLTEEDYFKGDLAYVPLVKEASGRPVLRKDFIFNEYQVYEARAAGADAILLIDAILDLSQAGEYLHMARELGMAVLYEVHDFGELERALRVDPSIIGINNRDLKTMTVDLDTTFTLKKEMPESKVVVSESGISTRDDVLRLAEACVDAALIGTSFMKARDIGAKVDELFGQE